jgi:hypothetical protein
MHTAWDHVLHRYILNEGSIIGALRLQGKSFPGDPDRIEAHAP